MDFRARPPARRRLRFATERDARGAPERSDKDMAVYRQGDACGFPKPAGRRWIALRITDDKYAGPSQMSPNYPRSLTVHEPSLLPSSSRTGVILRNRPGQSHVAGAELSGAKLSTSPDRADTPRGADPRLRLVSQCLFPSLNLPRLADPPAESAARASHRAS